MSRDRDTLEDYLEDFIDCLNARTFDTWMAKEKLRAILEQHKRLIIEEFRSPPITEKTDASK